MFTLTDRIGFMAGSAALQDYTTGLTTSEITATDAYNATTLLNDDNAGTDWWSQSSDTGFITFDLLVAKTAIAYSLRAVAGVDYPRIPITWIWYGSNSAYPTFDATIDTQTGVAAWAAGERRQYNIASPGSFRYYTFYYSAKTDSFGKSIEYEIAEMEILGY